MGELHFTIWHVLNEQYGSRSGIFNSSSSFLSFIPPCISDETQLLMSKDQKYGSVEYSLKGPQQQFRSVIGCIFAYALHVLVA